MQGLWPWSITMMFSPKFAKLIKKDGWLRTYQRGHKAIRNTQNTGGHADAVKCVGQDQFGNRYYEDFDVDHHHQRRWVEYADHFLNIGITTDRIPPGWNGWMSHTYDDVPTVSDCDRRTARTSSITSGSRSGLAT